MTEKLYRVVLRDTVDYEVHVVATDPDDAVEKACESSFDEMHIVSDANSELECLEVEISDE